MDVYFEDKAHPRGGCQAYSMAQRGDSPCSGCLQLLTSEHAELGGLEV